MERWQRRRTFVQTRAHRLARATRFRRASCDARAYDAPGGVENTGVHILIRDLENRPEPFAGESVVIPLRPRRARARSPGLGVATRGRSRSGSLTRSWKAYLRQSSWGTLACAAVPPSREWKARLHRRLQCASAEPDYALLEIGWRSIGLWARGTLRKGPARSAETLGGRAWERARRQVPVQSRTGRAVARG